MRVSQIKIKLTHKVKEINWVYIKTTFLKVNIINQLKAMHYPSEKGPYSLHLKCITWYKDSHSLFDYQSTKVSSITFDFPMVSKNISIYRKRDSISNCDIEGFQVVAVDQSESAKYASQDFQLLTNFATIPVTDKKIRLNFSSEVNSPQQKKINENQRLNTDESNSSENKTEQQTYLIVRKLKKENGEYLGYKLEPGQIVKLGRVEFFVSETCIDGKITTATGKNKARVYSSRHVMKYDPNAKKKAQNSETAENEEKPQCKICLEQTEDGQNFLFNPCVCMGSCGTVHLECLTQWIHFKVKKQVVGGTQHYNFQKFKCEVCKTELPMIIEINGNHKELLPIEKPQGNYLILEGACDKQKSVIMIQNIPNEGIKLGRGHECEIRITDISVSRNHGLIKNQADGFYIFDNKSKFGTLVRDQKMEIEISRMGQGVQIGRTVVSFELRKDETKEQPKISKSTKGITDYKFQ